MTPAERLLKDAKGLLLDFDGPMTDLMPAPANAAAADRARVPLKAFTLPPEIASTTDHLAVLRFALATYPEALAAVEAACTSAEVDCARVSLPSPEVAAFFANAAQRGQPVAVVSNNSAQAVTAFTDRYGLTEAITALLCRAPENVAQLKPHPHLVSGAARSLNLAPSQCVLIGDSASDIQAAKQAQVPVIAPVKSSDRLEGLQVESPDAFIER